jgi:integrase
MAELTVKYIEGIERRVKSGEPVKEWHPDKDGLILRVRKTGGMSFVLRRWGFGSLTLGPHTIGLATARKLAREAIVSQTQGVDPAKAKREARVAEKAPSIAELTLKDAITRWIERYAKPELRTWPAIERSLNADVVPRMGKQPLNSITRAHIARLVDDITDRGSPRQAALVYAYLHKMFNWCVSRGYLDANPATGLPKPKQRPGKERVLSDNELRIILKAVHELGYPFGPMFELLAFTGQRKMEIGGGRWSEIDLEKNLWNLPASRTKNKAAHSFPLSERVVAILKKLPKVEKLDLLFTTTGKTPPSGFSKIKARLDARVTELNDGNPISPWSFHDLRRTAATGMASLRVPVEVIEQVLNHKSGKLAGVAGIYNRHTYQDEMRQALEQWEQKIIKILASDT